MPLSILTSQMIAPVRHGFFTRLGGASSGIFQGLNCGPGSSDLAGAVTINRDRVAAALDVAPEAMAGVHQVHSADVVILDAPQDPRPVADGMVTARPGLALAVLTADCAPVLFADAEAGVIGAAHAGWRGALGGVLEATIEAMEATGARRAAIRAAIGPTISQQAYEVGPELFDRFRDEDPESTRYFANGQGDRFQFDLPGYALFRLRRAGIGDAEWTRACTYSDEERFYSYRRATHRSEADYGRLISAIRL
jgi:polyphenol oxidase